MRVDCVQYVFWITLREVLTEGGANFLKLEANLGETEKIEISNKLDLKHVCSFHVISRIGVKILLLFAKLNFSEMLQKA